MKALAAALVLAGCDVAIGVQSQGQAIVGGSIDTRDPAVVAIVPRRSRCEEAVPPVACSGTVIGPRAVLTAAHCILPGDGPGTLEVYAGGVVGDDAGAYLAVAEATRHPQFDPATHAYDLAVLRLAADAPASPIALPSAPLDTVALPATARVVGFGVTAAGTISDGRRRETTMTIGAVGAATFEATPAPGNSCGGDSGGPVFVTIGGVEQLAGVTSSGDATCQARATNARIDIAVDSFLRPALAAPDPAPGAIAIDGVCGATCDSAADCPAAMACTPDEQGVPRCQVAPLAPSHYGTSCETDAQCGGTCARIDSDVCRCAVACSEVDDGGGCSTGRGSEWALALSLAALARGRRRSA